MAINERISTGNFYRHCLDSASRLWQRMSFWTKASDVEFDDGRTAEEKLGNIKGITTSTNVTEEGYAADAKAVSELSRNLSTSLNNVNLYVGSNNKLHFVNSAGADTELPFSRKVKRYKLGSTDSSATRIFDVKGIVSNYPELTVDNFGIVVTGYNVDGRWNDVREGGGDISYDPSTGIASILPFASHEEQTASWGYRASGVYYNFYVYYTE